MIEKKPREIDKNYLKHVKGQSCLVCGDAPCDAHHIKSRATFGSDYTAICLCREHHTECHAIGKDTFQEKYCLDFNEARIKLLISYIKTKK